MIVNRNSSTTEFGTEFLGAKFLGSTGRKQTMPAPKVFPFFVDLAPILMLGFEQRNVCRVQRSSYHWAQCQYRP